MADTAKDILRERIKIFKTHERGEIDSAKDLRDRAARMDAKAAEWRKAIADLEAAIVKLGKK